MHSRGEMFASSFPMLLHTQILKRVHCGRVLELGPGSVWPGMSLCGITQYLDVVGLNYTEAECRQAIAAAKKNNLAGRTEYRSGIHAGIALPDRCVDAVISFGAMHAWDHPGRMLDEIGRVLKIGGEFFLGDARPDTSRLTAWLASRKHAALKEVYQDRRKNPAPRRWEQLLETTHLHGALIELRGPDMWIVRSGFIK